jgi:stage V sporulation protein G
MDQDYTQGPFRVRVYMQEKDSGNTLAHVSAVTSDVFAVKGIRVMKGKDGPFVSMPGYQTGDGKFHDICYPCTKEASSDFSAAVLHAYDQALSAQQNKIAEQLAGPSMTM